MALPVIFAAPARPAVAAAMAVRLGASALGAPYDSAAPYDSLLFYDATAVPVAAAIARPVVFTKKRKA